MQKSPCQTGLRTGITLGQRPPLPANNIEQKGVELYANKQLFHGPSLQLISSVDHMSDSDIVVQVPAYEGPESWMQACVRIGSPQRHSLMLFIKRSSFGLGNIMAMRLCRRHSTVSLS